MRHKGADSIFRSWISGTPNHHEQVIAVSAKYVLTHEYEYVFVTHRATHRRQNAGYHYGDPTCGLIAPDESWFATGGEGIVVLSADGLQEYLRGGPISVPNGYFPIHSMRLEDADTLRVLVDPWSELASVWTLSPKTGLLKKIHNGPDLRDAPYREVIEF